MSTEIETQIISRSPNILSGTPVFAGTRVPVETIIDYISAGHSLEEFLDDFPTVRREQAWNFCNASNSNSQMRKYESLA